MIIHLARVQGYRWSQDQVQSPYYIYLQKKTSKLNMTKQGKQMPWVQYQFKISDLVEIDNQSLFVTEHISISKSRFSTSLQYKGTDTASILLNSHIAFQKLFSHLTKSCHKIFVSQSFNKNSIFPLWFIRLCIGHRWV